MMHVHQFAASQKTRERSLKDFLPLKAEAIRRYQIQIARI